MKRLFIIITFLCLSLVSKAQGVFGASHIEVRDTLIKYGFQYVKSDKSDIGSRYDLYKTSDDAIEV